MLKPAFFYRNELQRAYSSIIYEEKYKYLWEDIWPLELNIENDDRNFLQFVSIDKNNEVIGFFQASLHRRFNIVDSLLAMNFTNVNYTFSKDVHLFIRKLFDQFNFSKITFEVIVGSPYEQFYDDHLSRYNGRVVGIRKDHVMCFDKKHYDVKVYELFP